MTRRDSILLLGSLRAGVAPLFAAAGPAPKLAPGAPDSPERMELIEAFRKKTAGLAGRFEARSYSGAGGLTMPYRLFQPSGSGPSGKIPLVVYLHGAGGLGSDNRKQVSGGNLFGSHLCALPENQERFPCYIVAPQTAFGWIRYDRERTPGGERPNPVPGFGAGARLAVEIIDGLRKEFPIDERRIYVTGNSMGGGGTWHLAAHRPDLLAAAIPVCGGASGEDGSRAKGVPLWNFHGDADATVPVDVSRRRIAELRKAGGSPIYTEYPGVGHNVSQWAYSEPALLEWVFAQRKSNA